MESNWCVSPISATRMLGVRDHKPCKWRASIGIMNQSVERIGQNVGTWSRKEKYSQSVKDIGMICTRDQEAFRGCIRLNKSRILHSTNVHPPNICSSAVSLAWITQTRFCFVYTATKWCCDAKGITDGPI